MSKLNRLLIEYKDIIANQKYIQKNMLEYNEYLDDKIYFYKQQIISLESEINKINRIFLSNINELDKKINELDQISKHKIDTIFKDDKNNNYILNISINVSNDKLINFLHDKKINEDKIKSIKINNIYEDINDIKIKINDLLLKKKKENINFEKNYNSYESIIAKYETNIEKYYKEISDKDQGDIGVLSNKLDVIEKNKNIKNKVFRKMCHFGNKCRNGNKCTFLH